MNILDSREKFSKVDKENVLGSIEAFPKQCLHAWDEASKIKVPKDYSNINKIVMSGMGGSGLGARIIESVFSDQLKYPLVRVNNYDLPAFVDQNTLVICSSYSGTTEEVVNTAKQTIAKKAKWMAIGTGATLIDLAQSQKVPFYKIKAIHNPSNQPRMAIGYSVFGQLALASKAGIISLSLNQVNEVVKTMDQVLASIKVEIPEANNQAKQLARKMKDRFILFISANHLAGAFHTVNNQLNENVKNISADYRIPELNHHLMEGLKHPNSNPEYLLAVFATSSLYPTRIKQRLTITQDVVKRNKVNLYSYEVMSKNKLSQAFELIQFGAYTNFYLAMLYGQNPAPIPWVDYFKTKLGQPLGK